MTRPHARAGLDTPAELARQVQAEYAEMPGLSVTLSEAQRLWNLDRATCEGVFRALVLGGYLRRTTTGRFVRA